MNTDASDESKALSRQDFETFRETAKAPALRRALAGFIVLAIVAVSSCSDV